MKEPSRAITTGISGEYFVAAELSKRGHIASVTLRNTAGVDVMATNARGTRSVNIQVKTLAGNAHKWPLNEKAEKASAKNLFYVFVTLRDTLERPEYFVVPSAVVANEISTNHQEWLKTPGRGGRMHRDNPIRQFDNYEAYREKWNLLGLDEE